jgi:heterodisulfide reductase subunit A
MMDAGRHPNIELLTYSEVVDVSGYLGNFHVRVKRKPRYVIEDLCTGCGECAEACVWKNRVPSEYEAGLGKRSAAYIPFDQAVPRKAVIDPASCLFLTRGRCKQPCIKACEAKAIDFEQQETYVELDVGAIILATGYDLYDPSHMPQYGYGLDADVITALQFERMTSAGGPTGGKVVLSDGREPEAIALLHCIGSRDENHLPHCSRVCCMYAIKQAHMARDKTGAEVYQFYIDVRAAGKSYEEFYKRIQEEGTHQIRGKVSSVRRRDGKLVVRAEDTLLGKVVEVPVDLVVLMNGWQPAEGTKAMAQMFHVSRSPDGFFAEAHPKLKPVETNTGGIFLAGACQSPKDIPDTVAQGSGAAVQAVKLLAKGVVDIEPTVAHVIADRCTGCGECTLVCPYLAISLVEGKAEVNAALCTGCGTCVAACVSKAIVAEHFTDEQLVAQVVGLLAQEEPAYV